MLKRKTLSQKERFFYHKKTYFICPICSGESGLLGLEVHHINSSNYDNREENLISLCGYCHNLATLGKIKQSDIEDKKEVFKDKDIHDIANVFSNL